MIHKIYVIVIINSNGKEEKMIETRKQYAMLQNIGSGFAINTIVHLEPSKAQMIHDDIIHPISELAAYTVNQANSKKKILGIKKEALLNPVIEIDDLYEPFDTIKEIDHKKHITLKKIYAFLFQNLTSKEMLALYEFQILNTRFASLGYFITPENKQDIYLKIIEEDNDELLDDLEIYLDAKIILDNLYKLYRKIRKAENDLVYAETDEEIQEIYDKFIQS